MKLKPMILVLWSGWLGWCALPAQMPFFEETFAGGALPEGWSSADDSGNAFDKQVSWQFCQSPASCPPFVHPYFQQAFSNQTFSAPTASNGYAYVHSEAIVLATADAPHLSRLTTSAINCVGRPAVVLQFYSHLGIFQSVTYSDAVLRVSTDSLTWNTFPIYPDLGFSGGTNQFTTQAAPVTIDISSVAAGQEKVYLQWQWTGKNDWSWSVDDIQLFDFHPHYFRAVWGNLPGQGDFQGGLNGWAVQNLLGSGGWTWEPNGWVGAAFTAPQDGFFLGSPTFSNGAAVMNADFYTTGGQFPPDPPIPYYVSELISPVIDLSETTEKLSLRFYQMARLNNPTPGYPFVTGFSYSLNGGADWSIPENLNGALNLNGPWETQLKTILLPDELIGQAEARLKFTFSGNLYGWALDDIVIFTRENHNLELKENFYALAPSLMRPAALPDSIHFLVDVENIGLDSQTQVRATVRIRELETQSEVFQDTLFLGTLVSGELQENLIFPKAWLPAAVPASYEVTYHLEADSTDQYLANNTLRWPYVATDSILSKELGPTGAFRPFQASSYTYGNCYYIPKGATAQACAFSFGAGNADQLAGKTVDILLYHWQEGDSNQDFKANPSEYTLVATNQYTFQGDENGEILTVPVAFDGTSIGLEEDSYYFAVVRYESTGQTPFFVLASENYDLQATYYLYTLLNKPRYITMLDLNNTGTFSIFGLGVSGFGQIPVARLHLCGNTSSTLEIPAPAVHLDLSPNPATNQILVEVKSLPEGRNAYRMDVFSAEGQLLVREKLEAPSARKMILDVSQFPNGTYFVQIKGRNFTANRSFVVQH